MVSFALPRSPVSVSERADVVVVGSDFGIVEACLAAGMSNIVIACSSDAFRHAMRRAPAGDTLIVIDAHAREHALAAVCREPELLEGRTVVIRGGALDDGERRTLELARSVMWCTDGFPATTMIRMAQLHRDPLQHERDAA